MGTAVYLVANDGRRIWSATGRNLADLSLALQASASRTLEECVTDLRGVTTQIGDGADSPAMIQGVLEDASRFESGGTYLGVLDTASGQLNVVSRSDRPVPAAVVNMLRGAIHVPHATPDLQPFVQLPGDPTWYLPVTSRIPASRDGSRVAFTLLPLPYLIAGAESLQVIRDSAVAVVASDGTVLLTYIPATHEVHISGRKVDQAVVDHARINPDGVLSVVGPRDQRHYLVGYSRSRVLPLFVAARVPWVSVLLTWLLQSITPVLVLLLGMVAVVAFGRTLRRTLLRQQYYVARQEHLAGHDSLTGLMNRNAFMEALEQALRLDPQGGLAVVLLDLNRFKDVNDTLGHAAGDQVLEESSRRLESLFVGTEVRVARLGGDELALVVPGRHSPDHLDALCERVVTHLGTTLHVSSVELNMTASMGIAVYPEDAKNPTELLRCADIAMYRAKSELRSHCRYLPTMDSFTAAMLSLQSDFAKALHEGTLTVAYQPKVRLRDGALVGVEALARWSHPVHGQVPPSEFVHLAETTELIHPFTRHILATVTRQMRLWLDAGIRMPVAINVSANNLLDNAFVDHLARILRESDVPPQLVELEVTESAVMRHPELILQRLQSVRDLGVTLSIDDFGTGYATLAYLKQLPVQQLKIDKSFIVNLMADRADQRIVRSAVQLAHGFGMTVVAEGVESAAAAEQLRLYGCDFAQGYHFGRPESAAQLYLQGLAGHLRDPALSQTGT